MLKKISIVVIAFLTYNQTKAQFFDKVFAGFQMGTNKYTGDLKDSSKTTFSFAANLTYELTEQFHIRGQLFLSSFKTGNTIYSSLVDAKSNLRSVRSALQEGSLIGEYEFLNLYEHKLTPYVFAGLGLIHFNPYQQYYQLNENDQLRIQRYYYPPVNPPKSTYSNYSLDMPYGLGLRYAISENTRLSLEWNRRYLFSDNMDHVYYGSGFPHTDYIQSFSIGFMFRLGGTGGSGGGAGSGKGGYKKDCPPVY